jgi:hypothetical protein
MEKLIEMLKQGGYIYRKGVRVEWDTEKQMWASFQPTITSSRTVFSESIIEALKVNPRYLDKSVNEPIRL